MEQRELGARDSGILYTIASIAEPFELNGMVYVEGMMNYH